MVRTEAGLRILGIPVRVEPSFLLISLMVGAFGGTVVQMITWVIVAFVAILVHELGHALVMRHYGFEPYIVLHGFGGLAGREGSFGRTSIWREVAISLAGPGAGLLLALPVFAALAFVPPAVLGGLADLLNILLSITVFWSVLNLVPMMPLDGGNVSRLLFLRFFPARPRLPYYLTIVVAAASIPLSIVVGFYFWAVISLFSMVQAITAVRALPSIIAPRTARRSASGQAVAFRGRAEAPAPVAKQASPNDDPLQAIRAAFVLSPDQETGSQLVELFVAARRFSALAAIAAGPDGRVIPGGVLAVAAGAALDGGAAQAAVDLGELAHARGAGVHASTVLARASGKQGRLEEAARWIEQAIADGVVDREAMRRAPELSALVGDTRWQGWMAGPVS
jgi:stage IV sporulation protein FB